MAWECGDTSANDGSMTGPREEVSFLAGGGSSLRIRLSDIGNQCGERKKRGKDEKRAVSVVKTGRLVGP